MNNAFETDDTDGNPRESRNFRDDRLLFSTENGWVRHCACRDRLVLNFFGHWLVLSRAEYGQFHARMIAAVRCPLGQRQLEMGGRFAFRTEGGDPAFALDRSGMEELLWLMDSARFMLEAGEAAARGFAASPANGKDVTDATDGESWKF